VIYKHCKLYIDQHINTLLHHQPQDLIVQQNKIYAVLIQHVLVTVVVKQLVVSVIKDIQDHYVNILLVFIKIFNKEHYNLLNHLIIL